MGPATLHLRAEISLRSKTVATVHHGERVEIIQRHRKFLKVRTKPGAEGWTDTRQLLSTEQMAELRQMAERAQALPSQGRATTFGPLNIHSEPNRLAPSFYQIAEGESVEVVGERLAPRSAPPAPTLFVEKKKQTSQRPPRPKREVQDRVPPPPLPAPPGPPPNWLELSRTRLPVAEEKALEKVVPAAVPLEDWSLVRTPKGPAGWVLTRNVRMAIPDEVAQYAEGHRITSYFPVGQVNDDGQIKNCWLWTTAIKGGERYQFDSFRVFVWSLRRHRYETAYVERNVRGYFPVEVRTVEVPSRRGAVKSQGFSVILETEDGGIERRTYAFQGYRVALVAKEPWKLAAEEEGVRGAPVNPPSGAPAKTSLFERLKSAVTGRR